MEIGPEERRQAEGGLDDDAEGGSETEQDKPVVVGIDRGQAGVGVRWWNHTSTTMTTRLLAIGTNIGAANLPRVFNRAVNRAMSP